MIFEHWLYGEKRLEAIVGHIYLDLIALDFKDWHFNHHVYDIVDAYLDYGECARRKLIRVLEVLLRWMRHIRNR